LGVEQQDRRGGPAAQRASAVGEHLAEQRRAVAFRQEAATDRAYRLLRTLPPEASRFVVELAGMWCIRAATVPDTFNPSISTWRRARSAALRPFVAGLIADFRNSAPARTEADWPGPARSGRP